MFIKIRKLSIPIVTAMLFIAGFLLSRIVNISELPIFADEAYAILRAKDIRDGGEILGMLQATTQPIFIWFIALLANFLPDYAAAGRMAAAISGLMTALILGKVSSRLIGKETFWWAFGLTTVLPFAVFYDRTALFESMTVMWMALSLLMPVLAVPLGILTKQTAWLVLPLAVGLNIKKMNLTLITIFSAVLIPFAVWMLAFGSWDRLAETMFVKTSAPISMGASFKGNFLRVKLWFLSYLTLPVIIVGVIGFMKELIDSIKKKWPTPLAIIGVWSVAIILFESLTARIFYPRYLYPVIIAAVLLAVDGLKLIKDVVKNRLIFGVAVGVLLIIPIRSDLKIIFDSMNAPLALEDKFQFFEDFTSGVGADKITKGIESIYKLKGLPLTVYAEDDNAYLVSVIDNKELRGVKAGKAEWLVDPLGKFPAELSGEPGEILFVRNRHPDIPSDWPVELVLAVDKTANRKVFLYRVIK